MKWIAKRDASFGHEISAKPVDIDNASDEASKKSLEIETPETKTNSPKKRSKKLKGPIRIMTQDEIMRMNHPG